LIRWTLVCDGTSDRVLTRLIDWTLFQCGATTELISQWADLRGLDIETGLNARLKAALSLYPCDLLFVHRDAELASPDKRVEEINQAMVGIEAPPHIPVIPVRMQEAWSLCDEAAIRKAASNPAGNVILSMPRRQLIEAIPDPKETVFALLRTASEKTGRRLRQFNVHAARSQIIEQMEDYSVLRDLESFRAFEQSVRRVVQQGHFDTWH
jgi:hypothetical protein